MKRINGVLAALGLFGGGFALVSIDAVNQPARAEQALVPMPHSDVLPEPPEQTADPAEATGHDAAAPIDEPEVMRPDPKPLSKQVDQGLAWLTAHQNNDGGWGQGEESTHMGQGMDAVRDVSNVADTSMAVLALIRAGSTPTDGPHAEAIRRGVDFVCTSVDASEPSSMWITDVRGTRLQGKIGQYIDTFVAALLLSEVTGQMPDEAGNQTVSKTLDIIINKIEKNQQADGRWENQGWAGGLGGALGVKALNRAAQNGANVDMDALFSVQDRVRDRSTLNADGVFGDDGQSAGIELYTAARELGELNDYAMTNAAARPTLEYRITRAQSENEKLKADLKLAKANDADADTIQDLETRLNVNSEVITAERAKIDNIEQTEEQLAQVRGAAVKRFDDPQFVAGFGNNGGEEFLSYLQVGEALAAQGGDDFKQWDANMTDNLNRIQNQDGSWSGHHCITGRTFCTSAALLVLTVDRAPTPVAAMGQDR